MSTSLERVTADKVRHRDYAYFMYLAPADSDRCSPPWICTPPGVQVEAVFDASVLNQLACVQNDRVYDITLSGVNAWFEAITVEPHVSDCSI